MLLNKYKYKPNKKINKKNNFHSQTFKMFTDWVKLREKKTVRQLEYCPKGNIKWSQQNKSNNKKK